ncbi:ankyrin repeat domain-containing protein [bacterium]|nr:ankyrin repeat domain-containing protein [bacterium]
MVINQVKTKKMMSKMKNFKLFEMSIPYKKGQDKYNALNAIYNNDVDKLEEIINKIGTLDFVDRNNMSPLDFSCLVGNIKMINILINKFKCDVNFSEPIYNAIRQRDCEIIKILIDNGVDLERKVSDKYPLEYAVMNEDNDNVIKTLLDCGSNPNILIKNDPIIFKIKKESTLKLFIKCEKTDFELDDSKGYSFFNKNVSNYNSDKWWNILDIRNCFLENKIYLLPYIKKIYKVESCKDLIYIPIVYGYTVDNTEKFNELYKKYQDDIDAMDGLSDIGLF